MNKMEKVEHQGVVVPFADHVLPPPSSSRTLQTEDFSNEVIELLYLMAILEQVRKQNRSKWIRGLVLPFYLVSLPGLICGPQPTVQLHVQRNLHSPLLVLPERLKQILEEDKYDFQKIQNRYDPRVVFVLMMTVDLYKLQAPPRPRDEDVVDRMIEFWRNPGGAPISYDFQCEFEGMKSRVGIRAGENPDHMIRRQMFAIDEMSRETVDHVPPPSMLCRCLCGPCCMYCHEGCSAEICVALFCWSCWPLCCWNPKERTKPKPRAEIEENIRMRTYLGLT